MAGPAYHGGVFLPSPPPPPLIMTQALEADLRRQQEFEAQKREAEERAERERQAAVSTTA